MKLAQKKEVCLSPTHTHRGRETERQGREGERVGLMGDGSARFSECPFSSTLAFFVVGAPKLLLPLLSSRW